MKSQYITIKELPSYLESAEFKYSKVIPISRQRGMAQAKNPRARPDDIALILLRENDRLLGYIGLLPDTLFSKEQAIHLAWMTCIWVSPNARGKGVASRLLKEAFAQWDNRLLATEFTAPAKRLYDKMNLFDDLHIVQGIRAYLHLNLAVLMPKKDPKYAKFRPLLQLGDGIFNIFNRVRLLFYHKKNAAIRTEEVDELDEACWQWINAMQKTELFRRTRKDLNWILKNPWLADSPEALADSQRYHFSIYEKRFRFVPLKIFLEEKMIGVLMLAVRGDALKIPYAWFEEQHSNFVAEVIKQFMLENNCSILTIYHQALVRYLQKNRSPFFKLRPFKRHYLIAKALDWPQQPTNALIQDGDGDCAFT